MYQHHSLLEICSINHAPINIFPQRGGGGGGGGGGQGYPRNWTA